MNGATVDFREGNIDEELRGSVKRKRASMARERGILGWPEMALVSREARGNPDLHIGAQERQERMQKSD